MKSTVAVLKTSKETILSDIEKLLELARLKDYLNPNRIVILKDNISWHLPFLSANTTPWQLEGTILALKKSGYKELIAVHNNTVVTNPFKGVKLNKLDKIYEKYDIPEKYNFLPQHVKWTAYKPKGKIRVLYKIFPEILIPEIFFGNNIVHLPTMKTHIYTTTTGSMKNAFGGLIGTKRHYTHTWIHETLVDLLTIQKEIHNGIFTVMDGTICGNGAGPRTMIPVEKNYILASNDSVAIDSVATKMMGFNPMDIPYICIADEEGLGNGKIENIEIVGEDISNENFNFKVTDNAASRVGDVCWWGALKYFQKLLFQTPLVYAFIFGSFIYHDFIWWLLKGKKIQEQLKKTSQWGRLFDEY